MFIAGNGNYTLAPDVCGRLPCSTTPFITSASADAMPGGTARLTAHLHRSETVPKISQSKWRSGAVSSCRTTAAAAAKCRLRTGRKIKNSETTAKKVVSLLSVKIYGRIIKCVCIINLSYLGEGVRRITCFYDQLLFFWIGSPAFYLRGQ